MSTITKQCPLCAEDIPLAAAACPYCPARFAVTSTGYCQTCHVVRDADDEGCCAVCGSALLDWHVESHFVEEEIRVEAAAAAPYPISAEAPPKQVTQPRKNLWLYGALAVVGVLLLSAVLLWLGRDRIPAVVNLIATSTFTAAPTTIPTLTPTITPIPTSTPDLAATRQVETQTALTVMSGTVTLWYEADPGSPDEVAMIQLVQRVTQENRAVTIAAQRIPIGQLIAKYRAAVQSGAGPDVILFGNDDLDEMAREGSILNVDGYLQAPLTAVRQFAVQSMQVDGQLYGVPEAAGVVVLYYDKRRVSQPPATTGELLSLVKKGNKLASPAGYYWFYGFGSAFGGQLVDSGGRCTAGEGGFVPAMQYLLELQKAGSVLQAVYQEAVDGFKSGKYAMLLNGSWMLPDLEQALGENLGVALLPGGPAGPAQPIIYINGFLFNPNSTNLGSAIQLALYLTTPASGQVFTDVAKHIPVNTTVFPEDPRISVMVQAASSGLLRPQNPQMENFWTPFNSLVADVLAGGISPQEGVERACREMNTLNGFP